MDRKAEKSHRNQVASKSHRSPGVFRRLWCRLAPWFSEKDKRFVRLSTRKLVNLRKTRGWTQEELAHSAGHSKKTIENAESGHRITLHIRDDIAAALEVDPQTLIGLAMPQLLYGSAIVTFLILLGGGVALWRRVPEKPFKVIPLNSLPGSALFPSFAPDGQRLAFSWQSNDEENFHIYVQFVGAGTPLRLTSGPAADLSPAWSPDGRNIAFIRVSSESSGIFVVPASQPSAESRVAKIYPVRSEVLGRQLVWSTDGKSLAVADKNSPAEPFSIFLFAIANREMQRLTTPPTGVVGDSDPAFSPDGATLSFVRTTSLGVKDLYVVTARGTGLRRLNFDNTYIYGQAWAPKGGEILFSSNRSGIPCLWRISASSGGRSFSHFFTGRNLYRVEGVGERALYPALSLRGDRLAYTTFSVNTNIWQVALQTVDAKAFKTFPPKPFISSRRHSVGPQFSSDGKKIVFASDRSGSFEIWSCDGDGKNLAKLTSIGSSAGAGSPRWSPDGTRIAFDSRAEGNANIYIINAQGGSPNRISWDPSENVVPSWSRDGLWVYFTSNRTGRHQIWKMAPDGSRAAQLTTNGGFAPFESPDRKFVYYAKGRAVPGLWKIPIGGGEETPVLESLKRNFWGLWAVGEQGIYFVDFVGPNGAPPGAIKFLSFATNSTTQVTTLERLRFVHYQGLTVSPDGKRILYPQLDQTTGEIMLVENFR